MRHLCWALPLLATGCGSLFEDIRDDVNGLLNPTVAIGAFTRLDPPSSSAIDLETLGLEAGLAGTVFLADAKQVSDLENAPIRGAVLEVSGCGQTVVMEEDASGAYLILPGTPLDSCPSDLTLTRTDNPDATTQIPLEFPAAPSWTLPETWRPGDPNIVIPVSASPFDSALALLADATTGDITYSNEPEDVMGYYEFLTGTGAREDITFTAAEMRVDTIMAAGLTGLVRVPNANMADVNTALSVVDVGRTKLYPISTLPPRP
jgi:hypothetical protein